ncbi:MAG: PfkB family carbohydrate kinase [Endomicrobiia bacterium]
MDLLIIGSVAFDSVETPFGKVKKTLGGSATYAALSARFFTKPSIVAVVGKDFKKKYFKLLEDNNINTTGIEVLNGKTFFWKGYYSYDLNTANTIETQINVFSNFNPQLDDEFRNMKFIFLGNIDPDLQYNVYTQLINPKIVACDTMNCWIKNKPKELKKVLKFIDIFFINESEIRQLTNEYNIIKAVKIVKKLGPKIIIVKRGEYGSMCFYKENIFTIPAYPLETVFDPTGAGDSFAGGVMGFIASKLNSSKNLNEKLLRQGIIFGTVLASFCVEEFSVKKLLKINYKNILDRYKEIKKITFFEDIK